MLALPAVELRVVDGALSASRSGRRGTRSPATRAGRSCWSSAGSTTGLTGWRSYSFGVEPLPRRPRPARRSMVISISGNPECLTVSTGCPTVQPIGKLRLGSNTPAIGYWAARRSAVRRIDAERPASAAVFTDSTCPANAPSTGKQAPERCSSK